MAAGLLIGSEALPPWAAWAVALGAWLADSRRPAQTVVAASAPTLGWLAAFAALGACTARAGVSAGHTQREIEDWGAGASVRFPFQRAFREGVIKGFGSRGVRIVQPNYTECWVPWTLAGGIERLPDGAIPTSRIRRPAAGARFRSAALGTDLAAPTNGMDCLIVGSRARLERELDLRLGIAGTAEHGPLLDLVRPRSLLGQKTQFRSDIVSPFETVAPGGDSRTGRPGVVMLDGSIPILRQLAAQWTSPLLCLIDRTEPRASDAAAAIEAARAASGAALARNSLPSAPDGIEVVAYERVQRRRD